MLDVQLIDEVRDELRRLGRHIENDLRNLLFAVENDDLLPPKAIGWPRDSPILNQGNLGSCTGNAMTGWLGCEPHVTNTKDAAQFDESFAVRLYSRATQLDAIPGSYPPDDTGSSGLAVAKAAKELGLISSYAHALTINGLLHALQYGPVIVGISWFEGFDTPDANGVVEPTGQVRGGHEVLVRGFQPGKTLNDGLLLADNSWGTSWGLNGSFKLSIATWRALLVQGADVVVPRI